MGPGDAGEASARKAWRLAERTGIRQVNPEKWALGCSRMRAGKR